jgi:uncharacterized membrane protein
MIYLALAALVAAALFRLWKGLAELQSSVVGLSARIERLERLRSNDEQAAQAHTAPATPPSVSRTPVQATAPPPLAPPQHAAQPLVSAVRPVVPPPVTPAPVAPAPAPAPPAFEHTRDAIEARIGSRWLLYVGIAAIVIGVAYFEKLAIENHWVSNTARVIQGGLLGIALVVAGSRFTRAGYRLYGQLVSGGGIAVLYVVDYAAFNLYHLLSQLPAFALMSAITLLAAWLADRQRSQGLALAAVGGGFVTPFLLGSGSDAEVALFGYDAILIAGTILLARRRDWPTLTLVSYFFTLLTVGAWAFTFYRDSKFLTTELFLTLFCAMFLYILYATRESGHPAARIQRGILWTAPALYHVASLLILGSHSTDLLVYLVLMGALGVIVSVRGGSRVRLAIWLAIAVPLLAWSNSLSLTRGWLQSGMVAWISVYVFNLAGLLEIQYRSERSFNAAEIALLHLNSLAAFTGMYLLLESVGAQSAGLAAAMALVQSIPAAISWRRDREQGLHFLAVAFSFIAVALAQQLDAAWITAGCAAEGTGVIALGLFARRVWVRRAGLAISAIAIARLIAIQFQEPSVDQLMILNQRSALGAFFVVLAGGLTWLHERLSEPGRRRLDTGVGLSTAALLLFSLTASEIVAYWQLHTPPAFEPASQLIAAGLLFGAALMGLGLRRQQEWMRGIGGALTALSAFALFAVQLEPSPANYTAILNGRVAASVFGIVVLYVLVRLHRGLGAVVQDLEVNIAVLMTTASLLTLSLLTSEINAFWSARGAAGAWSITHDALQATAWAAVGGFLIWRGLLSRHLWVRVVGGLLLGIAIIRVLVVQFTTPAFDYLIIANARVISALVLAAILFGLARLYGRAAEGSEARYSVAALRLLANVIGLTLLTSEITAYWHLHDLHLSSASSPNSFFAREMMLSITWAVYATILIVVGLKKRYAPIRYFAIAVFAVTIVKVFAVDLADLDRLYRVASIIGLGILLLVTAFLYQRLRIGEADETVESVR